MTQQLSTVLAVDLDHTLINTDMIFVGLKYLIFHKIYLLPMLIIIFLLPKEGLVQKSICMIIHLYL